MRNRWKSSLILFVVVLVLAACGGTADSPPDTNLPDQGGVEVAPPGPEGEQPPPPEPGNEQPAPPPDAGGEDTAPVDQGQPDPPEEPRYTMVDGRVVCTETDPHPIGEQIAGTYEREYNEVMTWFCNGDTFDDILIALQTSEATGVSVEELLQRNYEVGWDQVWEETGFTGSSDE